METFIRDGRFLDAQGESPEREQAKPVRVAVWETTKYFRWRCVLGKHPYPSRTRWLRPQRPMVLHWRRCGRAGGCQIYKKISEKLFYIDTDGDRRTVISHIRKQRDTKGIEVYVQRYREQRWEYMALDGRKKRVEVNPTSREVLFKIKLNKE